MNNILPKLQKRLQILEDKLKKSEKTISLQNNVLKALVIEKDMKEVISIDTLVGHEKINVNRHTIFNEKVHINTLSFDDNKIISNDPTGNIYLCPNKKKGNIILTKNPNADMAAVTKKYVDYLVKGFTIVEPVKVKTIHLLPEFKQGTKYDSNKIFGTKLSLNEIKIDSYDSFENGDRVMISNDSTDDKNLIGIYTIEEIGDENTEWCMKKTNDKIISGLYVHVLDGKTCKGTSWILMKNEENNLKFVKYSGDSSLLFSNINENDINHGFFCENDNSHVKFKSLSSDTLNIKSDNDRILVNLDETKIDILKLIKEQSNEDIVLRNTNDLFKNKMFDARSTSFVNTTNKNSINFDLLNIPENTNLNIQFPHNNKLNIEVVGKNTNQIITNKQFIDTLTWFCDDHDTTKKMRFHLPNKKIKRDTTVTLITPSEDTELVGTQTKQNLSNKIFDANTTTYTQNGFNFEFDFSKKLSNQKIIFPSAGNELMDISSQQVITNKIFDCATTFYYHNNTKSKLLFDLREIIPTFTCVLTVPKKSTEIVGIDSIQTLTNKTIDFNKNTIIESLKNNYREIRDPRPTDDTSKGYKVGSRWINKKDKEHFVCVCCNNGYAEWKKTT